MLLSGAVADGVITGVNRGGVLVQLDGPTLRGFMPFTKLDPARMRRGHQGDLRYLVGQQVRARVVQVDRTGPRRELVLSERAARAADAMAALQVGDVVRGRVERLEDYGALVALLAADGGAPSGATGLLHKSELSWELVLTPDAVLAIGQELDLQVVSIDAARNRVGLSLRALTRDPLMETLESIAWQAEGAAEGDVAPELQPIVAALAATPGISGVALGRRAEEARTVAQDVELYLTRDHERPGGGGFTLVARSGRTLLELLVGTQLSRDELRAACRRVLGKL